jgi:hypothetical protein
VKVDRVACPWLIKKFIDPEAEFVFLLAHIDWSAITVGHVYDVPNCERASARRGGPLSSFLAFLRSDKVQSSVFN